jgi:amidohydrolase
VKEKVKSLAKKYFPELIGIRHHLHAHPELSMHEAETAKYVAKHLDNLGIKYKTGVAGNGIVALIEGKNPNSKVIALRADMDALPITEKNTVSYKSKNEGVMHACGHDVHTTCLLGATMILNEMKDEIEGTIKLIFQPSEEKLPGGASLMIKEGVLENPAPEAIVGLHVLPSLETGLLGFKEGMYMASCDEIYITVRGKGGHAAMPADIINPLYVAADLLTMYAQLAEELKKSPSPVVLSFGKIIGNGATNIVPDEVRIEGTFRAMDETLRYKIHDRIRSVAEEVEQKHKAKINFELAVGYPYLVNNPALTKDCRSAATDFIGAPNVTELDMRMTSEDFSYYSHKIPACFFRLGTGNKVKGITSGLHTPTFDIDENALEIGVGVMAYIAVQLLNNYK